MRSFLCVLFTLSAAQAAGLNFEENKGQTDASVRYFTRTAAGPVFLTDDGITNRAGLSFRFEGANAASAWTAEGKSRKPTSYYIGRDPDGWVQGARHFDRVTRRNLYTGIDASFYGSAGRVEYDLVVALSADPGRIRLRVEGAKRLRIGRDGSLIAETAEGRIVQHAPVVFQKSADGTKRAIAGRFELRGGNRAGFRIGKYDRQLPLSIDPVLETSTYLGGSGDDTVIYTDGFNAVGNTTSIDFPGATPSRRHGIDIFIQTAAGTTVIGGSGDDVTATASATSSSQLGEILIGGSTNSVDFPTNLTTTLSGTPSWQPNYAGGATDGFVIRFDSIGSRYPWYISYLGTPGDDAVTAMSHGTGYTAIVGTTTSTGLPSAATTTPLAPQPAGGVDGFFILAQIAGGTYTPSLIYESTFGGSGDDRPLAVRESQFGYNSTYYIAGETFLPRLPRDRVISSHAERPQRRLSDEHHGPHPADFQHSLRRQQCGPGDERHGHATALSIMVGGRTQSADFPTVNPIQATFGGGVSDGFLARFSPSLAQAISSTFIGGSGEDSVSALASRWPRQSLRRRHNRLFRFSCHKRHPARLRRRRERRIHASARRQCKPLPVHLLRRFRGKRSIGAYTRPRISRSGLRGRLLRRICRSRKLRKLRWAARRTDSLHASAPACWTGMAR